MGDYERLPARPSPTSEFFLNQRSRRRERDTNSTVSTSTLPSRLRLGSNENNNTFFPQSQISVEDFIYKVEQNRQNRIRNQRKKKHDEILKELQEVVQQLRNYYQEFYKYHVNDDGNSEIRNKIGNIVKSMKEVKREMDSFRVNIPEEIKGTNGEENGNKIVYGISCPEKDHEEYVKTFETLLKTLAEIRVSNEEHSMISGIDIQKVYENMDRKVKSVQRVLLDAENTHGQLKKLEKALNCL